VGRGKHYPNLRPHLKTIANLEKLLIKRIVEKHYPIKLGVSSKCVTRSGNELQDFLNQYYGYCQGRQTVAIDPEGNVAACPATIRYHELFAGNIRKDKLSKIWKHSKIFKWFYGYRDKLKGHCKRCDSIFCEGCRAIAFTYTKDFFAPDPFCYLTKN
jgi:radical SAM protein with 4Fe4S-binding SPASM domain